MADKRIDIVELKSNNYPRWRNDLQVALIIANCSQATEHAVKPAAVDDDEWQKHSRNARAIILKALRDDFWRAAEADSPFTILRKIEDAFQPTSALISVLKLCKFFLLSEGIQPTQDPVKEITSLYQRCGDPLRPLIFYASALPSTHLFARPFLPLPLRSPTLLLPFRSRKGLSAMQSPLSRRCLCLLKYESLREHLLACHLWR
tara:strand:- start:138 stop:749 length:612 start_codon:yes stop_codon:yes gene_type:complete